MVLPETTFDIGGALTIGLGVALAAGLVWAGAGIDFLDGWLSAGIAVGFGAFFLSVGRAAARERRAELRRLEASGSSPGPAKLP
jgi:hypothetical protein